MSDIKGQCHCPKLHASSTYINIGLTKSICLNCVTCTQTQAAKVLGIPFNRVKCRVKRLGKKRDEWLWTCLVCRKRALSSVRTGKRNGVWKCATWRCTKLYEACGVVRGITNAFIFRTSIWVFDSLVTFITYAAVLFDVFQLFLLVKKLERWAGLNLRSQMSKQPVTK